MHTPTITYIATYATVGTALGTGGLAAATYWLGRKTRETATAAKDDVAESRKQSQSIETQAKAVTDQTAAVLAQVTEIEKQTKAVIRQSDAVKAQSDATAAQIELLREQADAAKRQSDAAEAALNASIQPLISSVPAGTIGRIPMTATRQAFTHRTQPGMPTTTSEADISQIYSGLINDHMRVIVPVLNIGSGVARLRLASLSYVQVLTPAMYVYARPPSVAATDQVVQIDFSSESEPYPGWTETLIMSSEPLLVEVAYSDVAGRQESTTHIVIEKNPSGRYRATRVDLDATPRFTDRADPPSLH